MIIGISGYIGSGKDTVATMIQYLICLEHNHLLPHQKDFTTFIRAPYSNSMQSGWHIKKFAGKLKEIVAMFTGYSLRELELPEIKNKVLGDEWQLYSLFNYGRRVPSLFTDEEEIRKFCQVNSNSQHHYTYEKTQRTVRWLLQTIGTDALRDIVHPNIWVNALMADYNPGAETTDRRGPHDNWIITDVRFPNEAKAIEARGGMVIRVNRSNVPVMNHESEIALDNYPFVVTLSNEGSLEDLQATVKDFMLKFHLL